MPLLYQDEHLVVVDKPANMLVHRSELDPADTLTVMTQLRDQLGVWVYPVHRLDRPTSGTLLFALSPEVARALALQFEQHHVRKHYIAIVRGHPSLGGVVRHPLSIRDDQRSRQRMDTEPQEALTLYHRLATATVDIQVDKRYPTSRYGLVSCWPRTGRRHQLRRHLKHLSHPIIGDSSYGKGPHNRLFENLFGESRLYLHSHALTIRHPINGQQLTFNAPAPSGFRKVADYFDWSIIYEYT
ncbi:MAG: pseudouridylate synthase [Marinobacter sp.]|nr:pseudouridylate synthase [Marinobacter sp.]